MVKLRTNCRRHSAISSLLANRVPETKGRNIYQRYSLQKFPQNKAIEKIWINEDRYRKDPRNQIIISTETNHKPRRTWQSDDTFNIGTNFILVDESATHLKETRPTSCQIFQDWFLSTANVALTQVLGSRWAAKLPANASAAILEWNAWVIQKWYFRVENTLGQIFSSTLNLRSISKVNQAITQVQNAHQLTEQQVQVFIYSRGKFRRITCELTSISREMEYSYWSNQPCTYFSKTNQISYDTHQETEPNYNNSILTIQRPHLRKYLSRNIPT